MCIAMAGRSHYSCRRNWSIKGSACSAASLAVKKSEPAGTPSSAPDTLYMVEIIHVRARPLTTMPTLCPTTPWLLAGQEGVLKSLVHGHTSNQMVTPLGSIAAMHPVAGTWTGLELTCLELQYQGTGLLSRQMYNLQVRLVG